MEDEELSSLVQAAEQLSSQLDDGSLGELPRVERNLRQIMEASNQLWIRASQTGGQETQGYVLSTVNAVSCSSESLFFPRSGLHCWVRLVSIFHVSLTSSTF